MVSLLTCLLLFNSLNAVYFRRYLWLVCVRPLIREKTSTRRRCIHRGGARELVFIVSSRAKSSSLGHTLGRDIVHELSDQNVR